MAVPETMEASHHDPLTQRERDILRLLTLGLADGEIAEELVLTVGTVKWYNRQIYSKLGVRSRAQATLQAQRLRLIDGIAQEHLPAAPKHNLPAQITSFIGREQERAELRKLLKTARLVTMTGPPGTGKTRLSLEVARDVLDSYRDGVYFVPLAPLRDPSHVISSIAQALEISEGSLSLSETLKQHLRPRSLLLLLDNFEHLLSAAPTVSDLLSAAPQLTVLITSREILRLYGEHEYQVPPLQLPDLKRQSPVEVVSTYESVELFLQRACAVSPGLALNNDNAASIAAICVHLDGLPLALELAAARTRLYPPQALLVRLGSRLDALVDGPRDLPARQKTLRDTLRWSYDLLDDEEKVLFARLGVFVGGFTLESACAVCCDGLTIDIAAGLESLLNKSLLRQEARADETMRFMMLETMREYALEKLAERQEIQAMRRYHADYFLILTEQAGTEFYSAHQLRWLKWFDGEHDNLRAALRWFMESEEIAETILSFVASLADFWEVRAHWSEGRRWIEAVLDSQAAAVRNKPLADVLHRLGNIAYMQSDYRFSRARFEEAQAIYHELGDLTNAAHTLIGLGEIETEVGDYQTAMKLMHEGYRVMRAQNDLYGRARALMQLGWGAMRIGDYAPAREWLEESLTLYTQLKPPMQIAITTSGLGEVLLRQGYLERADEVLNRSLILRREIGDRWGTAASLGSLGWVALLQGDYPRAAAILQESISIRYEISDKGGMAWCLEKLAELALLQGQMPRAGRVFGAASALRSSINSIVDPADQPHYRELLEQIRVQLGEEIFEVLWSEGQTMTLEQVIFYVLPAANE